MRECWRLTLTWKMRVVDPIRACMTIIVISRRSCGLLYYSVLERKEKIKTSIMNMILFHSNQLERDHICPQPIGNNVLAYVATSVHA